MNLLKKVGENFQWNCKRKNANYAHFTSTLLRTEKVPVSVGYLVWLTSPLF